MRRVMPRAACAAVIPCLNEAKVISSVVRGAREHVGAVVVVDDGSSDETSSAASAAGAIVLRHATPQGKGAALRKGWRHAVEHGFSWALTMDGDGQHSPDDIPLFLAAAARGPARLIVGNRMNGGAGMPWLRRRVNRWMSARLSRAAGIQLPDSQCGFRLMDLHAWSGLQLQANHFEVESEVLLAFHAAGYQVAFVPIRIIYQEERSKIRPLKDTWRWFRWYFRHSTGCD